MILYAAAALALLVSPIGTGQTAVELTGSFALDGKACGFEIHSTAVPRTSAAHQPPGFSEATATQLVRQLVPDRDR